MNRRIAGALAILSLGFLMAATPAKRIAHFRVILERHGSEWLAQCDSGCAWTKLSMTCNNNCQVLIDATGVIAQPRQATTDAAFGFVLSGSGRGWQAESVAGTAWTKVGWRCPWSTCRVRIDESGVRQIFFGGRIH